MKFFMMLAITLLGFGMVGCTVTIVQGPGAGTPPVGGTLPPLPPLLPGAPSSPLTTPSTGAVTPSAPTTGTTGVVAVPAATPVPPPVVTTPPVTTPPVSLPVPQATTPAPGAGGTTAAPTSFGDISGILSSRCVRCHPGFASQSTFDPEKATAVGKLSSGEMPLAGSPEAAAITADEKTKLTAYCNGQ